MTIKTVKVLGFETRGASRLLRVRDIETQDVIKLSGTFSPLAYDLKDGFVRDEIKGEFSLVSDDDLKASSSGVMSNCQIDSINGTLVESPCNWAPALLSRKNG